MKLNVRRPRFSLLMLLLTLIISATVAAVQAQPAPDMTGRFAVRYGDKLENGKLVAVPPQAGIYDKSGVYHPIDLSTRPLTNQQLHNLFGKEVNLYGLQMTARGIAPQDIVPSSLLAENPKVTGPQPRADILCSLPGSNTPKPHTKAFYEGLYRNQYPSIENYWETMTNGTIYGLGPHVFGWYNAPGKLADYQDTVRGGYNLEKLMFTCAGLADADINFPDYVGINLLLDADIGAAYGGVFVLTLDGQEKAYRATWYPPYEDPMNFLSHEVGHSYNMDHSCGSGTPCDEYQDHYTQMSDLALKCDTARDPLYGCIPLGLDSWDLFQGGWVRVKDVDLGQYREETLQPLYVNGGKTQALVLRLNDTQSVFVEARKLAVYDVKLYFAGVVLHFIDISSAPNSTFINVAGNGDDTSKGALLTAAGKKYTDPQGQFTVCLNSISGGNYTVAAYVGGDCSNPPPPPTVTPTPTVTPGPTNNVFEAVSDIDCHGHFTMTVTKQVNVRKVQWTVDGKVVTSPTGNIGTASLINVRAQVTFNDGTSSTFGYIIERKICGSNVVYLPVAHR